MKHLFNNLSSEEKERILEQHSGGKKIFNENFSKLISHKLGDAKPLINEQEFVTDSEDMVTKCKNGDCEELLDSKIGDKYEKVEGDDYSYYKGKNSKGEEILVPITKPMSNMFDFSVDGVQQDMYDLLSDELPEQLK